jgi:hypothetical protein
VLVFHKAVTFRLTVVVFNHAAILDTAEVLEGFAEQVAVDVCRQIVTTNDVTSGSVYPRWLLISSLYHQGLPGSRCLPLHLRLPVVLLKSGT